MASNNNFNRTEEIEVPKTEIPFKDTLCQECGQYLTTVTTFIVGNGASEMAAVQDQRMTNLSLQEALSSDMAPDFKVTNVSVYDKEGHYISISKGLIEAGKDIYLSGTLHNIMNEEEILQVDRIGPLDSWKKPHGWKSPLLVLSTQLEGKLIEYHMSSEEFTDEYKEALKTSVMVQNFFKVTKEASKRKSCPNHDSDNFEPARKKNKSSKACSKSKKRTCLPTSIYDPSYGKASHFQKKMDQVGHVLKSLNQVPGFGDCLVNMLPEEHSGSSDAVASFLCFVLERQNIWLNKREQREVLTTNHVLASKWFTNIYRELDRGTMYLHNHLNQTDLKGFKFDSIDRNLVSKILLKSIVYRVINKVETFMDFGGVPDVETYSKFLKYLHHKKKAKSVIFTAAHQNMGFDRLMKTLEHLKKNIKNLSSKLVSAAQKRSLKMCQTVLLTIPNIGDFLSWQILCDLLGVP